MKPGVHRAPGFDGNTRACASSAGLVHVSHKQLHGRRQIGFNRAHILTDPETYLIVAQAIHRVEEIDDPLQAGESRKRLAESGLPSRIDPPGHATFSVPEGSANARMNSAALLAWLAARKIALLSSLRTASQAPT